MCASYYLPFYIQSREQVGFLQKIRFRESVQVGHDRTHLTLLDRKPRGEGSPHPFPRGGWYHVPGGAGRLRPIHPNFRILSVQDTASHAPAQCEMVATPSVVGAPSIGSHGPTELG